MDCWWYELEINLVCCHVRFQEFGTFIVHDLEVEFQPSCFDLFMHICVGCVEALLAFVFDSQKKNVVSVIVIEYKELGVT